MSAIEEALTAREAGLLDSDGLVARLAACPIRSGPGDRPPTDPAELWVAVDRLAPPVPGTWAEVVDALDTGRLSWTEYEALSARVESETPDAD